jgi:hypothetical protein
MFLSFFLQPPSWYGFHPPPMGERGQWPMEIFINRIHVTHNMNISLYVCLTWWHINTIRGEQGTIRMGFTFIGSWSRKVGVQNIPSWTSLINSILDSSSTFGFSNSLVYNYMELKPTRFGQKVGNTLVPLHFYILRIQESWNNMFLDPNSWSWPNRIS